MSSKATRSRAQYVEFLHGKISEAPDDAVRAVLEAATLEASSYDRSLSPLSSLSRLVEACDAIENGEAAVLARELGRFESKLRPGRTPINSRTVDAYIRLREDSDQRHRRPSEWTGPREETLRRPGYLNRYLEARQEAVNAKPRLATASRARRVEELVAALPTPEDRQDMRFVLEKGYIAQRELALLKKGIETNFPAVRLDTLLGKSNDGSPSAESLEISDDNRRSLAQLRNKLQDNEQLRHFGMMTDGHRLKLIHNGAHVMNKQEYEGLLHLLAKSLN